MKYKKGHCQEGLAFFSSSFLSFNGQSRPKPIATNKLCFKLCCCLRDMR
jgi:hypothetical protein